MSKPGNQPMSFYYIVVVWGDDYVDMLLNVSMRCFLSDRNIPSLAHLIHSKFIFVTTQDDFAKISRSLIYKKLERYITPLFVELDAPERDNVYWRATRGYELGTKLAIENQAYAVYLLPDCVISNGTLLQLEQYARGGRDVVLVPGPRIVKEKFMSYVQTLHLLEDDPLQLEPRKLAGLGLDFFHAQFNHYNYTDKKFTKWPHMVSWNIPSQEGLLIRAFHLHPLLINCSHPNTLVSFNKCDTIDGSFIQRNFCDLNTFLWEKDSDNIILYSMTPKQDRLEDGLLWNEAEKKKAIIEMSQSNLVNELQKIHFYNAYKLHTNDLNSQWNEVQNKSFLIVKEILSSTLAKKTNVFSLRMVLKKLINTMPKATHQPLRRFYWKMRGAVSWCRTIFNS